ncbi:MAG: serine/threonine protein kinase [Myxococcales bacterium]|nr:serine/threonine protein kinase [Myxococcales bacterium]
MSEEHDLFGLLGQVLDSRYRVEAVVGEGGFGVVYRGFHLSFRKPVAIKVLKAPGHFTPAARHAFVDKFREEGQLLSQLSDAPGIVRVFDFGVVPESALGEAPYLVLEWLEGQTLEALLAARRATGAGRLSTYEAVALLAPAIDAVAYAHSRKIAHRDIKPANVFVVTTERGVAVKVLDFGIGKAMQEGESTNFDVTGTKSTFQAFSPRYGAPEQFFSRRFGPTGPWTDVHALGLVLVEMWIGRAALDGDDSAELLVSATAEHRPTPRNRGVAVPDALEAVLARALALNPRDRFADAQRLLDALRAAMAELGTPLPAAQGSAYGHVAQVSTELVRPSRSPAEPRVEPPEAEARVGTEAWLAANRPQVAAELAADTELAPAPATAPARPAATGEQTAQEPERSDVVPAPVVAPAPTRAPWLVAALVAVLGAVAGLVLVLSRASGGGGVASSSAVTYAEAPRDEVVLAIRFEVGQDVYPVTPITERETAGAWHARLVRRDGRVVSAQRVRPSGDVDSEVRVEHGADGSRTLRTFDAAGVESQVQTITADGLSTVTLRSGEVTSNGCYRARLAYDAQGHVAESTCLTPTGVVISDAGGCPQRRYTWSAEHTNLTETCYDVDADGKEGRPTADWGGLALAKYRYDERGLRVAHLMFDVLGAAGERLSDGCYGERYEHDAAHDVVATTCLDATGAPRARRGQLVAQVRTDRDARGCVVRESYRDVSGKAVSLGPVAYKVTTVDARCRPQREETRGAGGELVAEAAGLVAVRAYEYDEHGDVTALRCFGAADLPTSCAGDPGPEHALVRFTRDARGRPVSQRSFAADGTPTRMGRSYPHETRIEYGDDGRERARAFFDDKGQPEAALGGVARIALRRDALGGEVSQSFFAADGQPTDSAIGCHEIRRAYDDHHRLESIECRNTAGMLQGSHMTLDGVTWPEGAARVVVTRGDHVKNLFVDSEQRMVASLGCASPSVPCHR